MVGNPLKKAHFRAAMRHNDQDRPGIAFTFPDYRGKASGSLNLTDQARNFQMRGKANFHGHTCRTVRSNEC